MNSKILRRLIAVEEKPKEVDNRSMADLLREKREATEKILEE